MQRTYDLFADIWVFSFLIVLIVYALNFSVRLIVADPISIFPNEGAYANSDYAIYISPFVLFLIIMITSYIEFAADDVISLQAKNAILKD